jgi:hypothetical protein
MIKINIFSSLVATMSFYGLCHSTSVVPDAHFHMHAPAWHFTQSPHLIAVETMLFLSEMSPQILQF